MQSNGITRKEETEYYFNTIPNMSDVIWALKKLIIGVNESHFTDKDIIAIKDPIYEEIRMYNDDKFRRLRETIDKCVYKNYNIPSIGGTINSVQKIDKDIVNICHEAFYQPCNEKLYISGNFNEKELLECLKKICKKKPKEKVIIDKIEESDNVHMKSKTIKIPTSNSIVRLAYKLNVSKLSSEEKYKYDYYLNYLLCMNFGINSTLREKLLSNNVIIDNISYFISYYKDYAIVYITANVKNEKKFIDAITNVFKGNFIFDQSIFNTLSKEHKLVIINREDYPKSLMNNFIANQQIFNMDKIATIADIDNLSFEEFKSYINKLSFDNYCCVKLEDEK